IGDSVGRTYLFTTPRDRSYAQVGAGVSLGDGACGVVLDGAPAIVYFATDLFLDGTITSTAERASTDGSTVEPFGVLAQAGLFGPSPDGPDHVLVVRAPLQGDDQIWRIDARADD